MNVTLVIIAWAKTLTNDYPRSMMYFEQTDRQTLAYNTSNERGMEYWIATMEFLADRYSKSENMGLVQKFVIGNEIDYTYDWYLLQPLYGSAEYKAWLEPITGGIYAAYMENTSMTGDGNSKNPSTGDNSDMVMWLVILVFCAGGIALLMVIDRKKQKKK